VESTRLTEFYRTIISWPKTRSELATVAEAICKLLEVPFAAVYTIEEDEKVAYRVQPGIVSETSSPEMIEEMLRAQLKRTDEIANLSEASPKQVQITRETAPLAAVLAVSNLTIAPIPRPAGIQEMRATGASTSGSGRKKQMPGWVVAGSIKPLSDREMVLLLSAAQRLSELAAVNRLENAIQLRSQFFSIASHELKTPLTSIYGILQLQERMARMKKDEPVALQEERKESFLRIVIRQVERLNELIDGLLDVSRIQNGRFMVEPADVDVAMILRETVNARLVLIAKEAGVTLNTDAPDSLHAFVDPVRMEEVVTNLVMNAIRFSPEGGVVWIKLRGEGGSFRLTVRDQGPSVPVEDRERIFQPFERAQRTSRLGGLGLGLYISRQIAQLHGGNVSLVESVPGKGNVFEAYFPVSAGARVINSASA
jgi:signal transduction histidine kinase